ncbi:hypothetical protein, partial [Streptomyces albus]|uniref:hypothetical protein n=1 Tax=Streptomyces albus TaxID=1888 RepID=UPI0039EE7790
MNRNGNDTLQQFIGQLEIFTDDRGKASVQIQQAHFEIIMEVFWLILELALLEAIAVFTGGASVSEMILARMRARLAILFAIDRLLRYVQAFPSLSEAFEEAIQNLAAQLLTMTINAPEVGADKVNWKDVGLSGAVGGLAGFFIGHLAKGAFNLKNHLSNYFKTNFDKDIFGKFEIRFNNPFTRHNANNAAYDLPSSFVAEGAGETAAVAVVLQQGDAMSALGAGLSGASGLLMAKPLEQGYHGIHKKLYPDGNLFTKFQQNSSQILLDRLSREAGGGSGTTTTDSAATKFTPPPTSATPPSTVGNTPVPPPPVVTPPSTP